MNIPSLVSEKKLSTNLKILLTIHTLFSTSIGMSNIFLNIFIWKYTQSFSTVMQYNLIGYITLPLTFVLAGWFSKRKGLRNNLIFGMILYSLFFIFIISVNTNIINYVWLIGALRGIASGLYFVSFNVLGYDYSNNENRDYFLGILGSIGSLTNMIAPLIAGYIISFLNGINGYSIIFITSFVLFFIGSILCLKLDNNFTKSKCYLPSVLQYVVKRPNWTKVMFAEMIRGFRDVKVVSAVVNVLIFIIVQNESSIGNYSFWTFLAGLISCYVAGIILNPKNRTTYMLLGAISIIAVSGIFLFDISIIGLWIFGIINSIVINFVFITHNSISYAVINSIPNSTERRVEAMVVKELFLNCGRIISFTIFILISNNNKYILIFLFILGLTQIGMWLLHRNIDVSKLKPSIQHPSIDKQQKFFKFGKTYYTSFNINFNSKNV